MHAIGRLPLRRALPHAGREGALRALGSRVAAAALAIGLFSSPLTATERAARVAFLGDAGSGDNEQKAVRDQLERFTPGLVFLLGDNIDDDGSALRIKERFDDVYAPLIARGVGFHAALGNHDVNLCRAVDYDPLPADANAYRWRDPGCDVEFQLAHRDLGYHEGRRYYSVASDDGPEPLLEVFVLDSNTLRAREGKLRLSREDSAQVDWLDRSLGASHARWKVVTLHHPPQTPRGRGSFLGLGPGGHQREPGLEVQLGPIFRRHGVDAVFAGHNHFYARMLPRIGVRFFVSGGGGRPLYDPERAPGYAAAAGRFHHFVYVRASESRFEYYAIDSAGRSRDAGWFGKDDPADTPFAAGTLPPPAR